MAIPKALEILKSAKSAEKRAKDFLPSIQRNINEQLISPLLQNIEKLEDKLCDLKDFSLATDLNAGQVALTREQCIERFSAIINTSWELTLAKTEYEAKQETFKELFG